MIRFPLSIRLMGGLVHEHDRGLIPIRPRSSLVLATVVWADDTSSDVNAANLESHRH